MKVRQLNISQKIKTNAVIIGAGAGVIVPFVLRKVIDPMLGPIPVLSDYIGAWAKWGTFIPIVSGAVLMGIYMFKRVKTSATSAAGAFGITSLLAGFFNGLDDTL